MLEQIDAFSRAGANLLLLQCSPQMEEMERFAQEIIGTPYLPLGAAPTAGDYFNPKQ